MPVQHIGYAVYALRGDNISDNRDSNLKVVKILRLARMSKMLRLARIKRILMKYQDSFANLMQYMSMYVLVFVIVFLSHMLSCFFYLVGLKAVLYIMAMAGSFRVARGGSWRTGPREIAIGGLGALRWCRWRT